MSCARGSLAVVGALALAACGQDVDPPWQLDHDRVIAVRATPPRLLPNDVARLDGLLGRRGGAPYEAPASTVAVVGPTSLARALVITSDGYRVIGPSEAALAAARTELALAANAPVPLQLRVGFPQTELTALKVVWLGERADNVSLGEVQIAGADASAQSALRVRQGVEVPVAVSFDESHNVNWLTSCGTMHDFDLPRAYLRVEKDDPKSGSFAVVVRDERGGVAWKVWEITAE